jgi:hypothetical protein
MGKSGRRNEAEENVNMNIAISAAVMAVMSLALGFVVHGWLLAPDYKALGPLFRPEEQQMAFFGFMIAAHILIGIGFTWIYRMGREARPFLGQGVRFGLAAAVLAVIPMYLIYYAVQPMPGNVVAKQIVFGTIGAVLMGIVCAWINQDRAKA